MWKRMPVRPMPPKTAAAKRRDLTGFRSGKLVVVGFAGMRGGHAAWECKCDCGGSRVVMGFNLQTKKPTQSCGCAHSKAHRRAPPLALDPLPTTERIYAFVQSWAVAAKRLHGNVCMRCGWDKGRCDVHHKVPRWRGGLHTLSNAIVLCPNCHRLEHEHGNRD